MRPLRVGILDLVARAPTTAIYSRVMNPNLASIMPQVVAVWCEQAGHDVTLVCYTGFEDLHAELPHDIDVVFISAFSQSAQLAYALSNMFRQRGAVTVLGGPHARCYPEDAGRYFDYVLGFTDRNTLLEVLRRSGAASPAGTPLGAAQQPRTCPASRERWKFIEQTLAKAPAIKIVPMLAQPRLPVHLQLLHRLDGGLPAARLRPDRRTTSASCSPSSKQPDRRLARPELRRALRREHGRRSRSRPAGRIRLHRREQPVAAVRAAPQAPAEERLQGDPARHRVVVRPRQQVEDAAHAASTRSRRSPTT